MNGKRLASVLRIRHLQERASRGALAASRHSHRSAESAERQTWDLLDERTRGNQQACSASALRGAQMYVAAGMLAAETQHVATINAEGRLVSATAEWTLAARRVEGLERLMERQSELAREEAVRASSNEIDDLVLVRFAGGSA
jgi:flagellar export protein FliJ